MHGHAVGEQVSAAQMQPAESKPPSAATCPRRTQKQQGAKQATNLRCIWGPQVVVCLQQSLSLLAQGNGGRVQQVQQCTQWTRGT